MKTLKVVSLARFRLKLKKVGKITRPFRCDLNQILYYYTEEVTNGFKGLDLIDRLPEELWMEVRGIVQEAVIKTIPKKRKFRRSQVGGGIGRGDHFLFYKFIERTRER